MRVDEPQLFTTLTDGVGGAVLGNAVPLPGVLVQPFTVCVTVYTPGLTTVIEEPTEPLLHNNEPVYPLAVNIDDPQLSTTPTDGAGGMLFGDAFPLPGTLVQPFTVCVTV